MTEGASSTNEGATRAAIAPLADQRTAPLPYPLPLEPMGYDVEPGPEPELPPPPELVEEAFGEQVPEIPLVPPLEEPATNDSAATVRRSNRTKRPSTRMQESLESHLVQVMESIVLNDDDPVNGVQPLLAYATSSDPDILNLKQAMLAHDKKYFLKAMRQEFDSHTKQEHWVFVLQSLLP